jgi:hypothetical protein
MRVAYKFRDSIDEYDVDAEVYPNGRVAIVEIQDSYRAIVDYEDFSESEQRIMKGLALRAKDMLEGSEEAAYAEDDLAGVY